MPAQTGPSRRNQVSAAPDGRSMEASPGGGSAPLATAPIRILTFSTLFPNSEMPRHGIFVAERLRHLLASGDVSATVMAPVPWFPSSNGRYGDYARYAKVQREGQFENLPVFHPRYLVVPKIGMNIAPLLLAYSAWQALKKLGDRVPVFDLIDAHYFYPDGVAAAILGRWLNKPVIITGRGTDLNLIPDYRIPRRMIRWAAGRAASVVTVSEALGRRLTELGVSRSKLHVLRNGVDLSFFRPLDRRSEIRDRLGITGRCLVSVGNLIEGKGHHLVIDALSRLPEDMQLVIAGHGPWMDALERRAREAGVAGRVRLVGDLSRAELVEYYNAADALVLASRREGMPNVVLESLACGTPVVATDVGGVAEILTGVDAGELVAARDVEAIAMGIKKLLERNVVRSATRQYAEQFSWDATTQGQLDIFRRVLSVIPG